MAGHQLKLNAVHRAVLERYIASHRPEVDIDELDWLPDPEMQPSPGFLAQLRELLPNDTSWGPCEEYESNDNYGSDLRIWHAGEDARDSPVETIQFRYSARDPIELLHRFVKLVATEDCVLISVRTGTWFEPIVKIVEGHLRS